MLRCIVCECHVVAPLARRASSSPLVCVASGSRLINGSLQRAAFTSVRAVCCGSAATVQHASSARLHSTAAADTAAAAPPRSSGFGKHAASASSSTSPNQRSAVLRHSSSASSPVSLPPPPPLSILSWTVDGSGHSHHRCRRRLSMEQRIPLLCETIRRAAADVVALQDSTAELAAALTADAPTDVSDSQLKVYCLEQTRERRPQLRDTAAATDAGDGGQEDPQQQQQQSAAEKSELEHDHRSTPPSSNAVGDVAESQSSTASAAAQPSTYRLVGSARNGRCGEVQVFVKNGSAWSATLLPCLGAGVTVELTSHTTTTSSSRGGGNDEEEDGGSAPTSDAGDAATMAKDEASTASAATATAPSPSPLHPSSSSPLHTCVLTTADLSYRGKSLGTHLQGLLSDSAVSMDGSPFTLQTPMAATAAAAAPSLSSSPSSSPRRVAGQLDAHRAIAFEWVHHHVRPDILVGNFFTGARERVPGFDDAWVRAGSPAGQERTTNTCARHRVDRMTNYFYFCPSSGVASRTAVGKVLALEEEEEGAGEQQRGDGFGEGQGSATVAVAADAAVGQPIPLDAQLDEADGTWYAPARGKQLSLTQQAQVGEERDGAARTAADAVSPALLSDLSAGMPEVAGRFQRCLFRSWVRRGASSRSGHLSAHPFLRQYRRCRVVVLRPMVEVSLAAAERAWHTRYISAQYHLLTRHRAQLRAAPGGAGELSEQEGCAAGNEKEEERAVKGGVDSRVEEECSERSESGEASDTEKASVVSLEELVRLPPRVRCSLSDQFPLVTILS